MSRINKGVIGVLTIVFGLSVILGVILWKFPGWWFNIGEGKKIEGVTEESGIDIKFDYAPEPDQAKNPDTAPKQEPADTTKKEEKTERKSPKPSRAEQWYKSLGNATVWRREGADDQLTAMGNLGEGLCDTGQPLTVPIKLSMEATTDEPGEVMGNFSEDIQGTRNDGSPCVAIPATTPVTFEIAAAGDYPTNRAPMTVKGIWLDGQMVSVGKKAVLASGIPGVNGETNFHTGSKIAAGVGSVLLGLANNASRFGSVSVSGSAVTDPVQDVFRKKLERRAEIHVKDRPTVYVTIDPIKTKGY